MRKFLILVLISISLIFILNLSFSLLNFLVPTALIEENWSSEYDLSPFVFKSEAVVMAQDIKTVNSNNPDNNGTSNQYFAGGSGTVSDPYLIENAEQLDNIRYHMDKNFRQISDIKLVFPRQDKGWIPLRGLKEAYWENFFTGSYDGGGFNIYNLTMNRSESKIGVAIGLFATIGHDAVIKNLHFKNVDIYSNSSAAAVAGVNYGDILKCSAQGNISGNGSYIGGIAGTNTEGGRILESYFEGNIEGDFSVGGLAGNNSSGAVIRDSYFHGTVLGEDKVGGIVGGTGISAVIKNCYMVGNVGGDYTGEISGNTNTDPDYQAFILNSYYLEQVREKSYFEGWDFNKIWAIKENKSYPYLKWQNEKNSEDETKNNLENWKANPSRLDFGEKVILSYNIFNDSGKSKKYIVKPVLIKPDGSQKDDLNSQFIELKPYKEELLSWEISPAQMGSWDLNFLIWDYEVLEKVIWELYKENTDWKKVGSKLLSGSYLQRKGPFKDSFLLTNEDVSEFKKKLKRSRKHIFTFLEIPDQKNWAGELIDKYSGVEEAYRRALDTHNQAKNNWKKAETYLQNNNLEAAHKFLDLALADNFLAHSILTDSEDIFIEVATKGEKASYTIMRTCQESAKFIALLHFGPEGYKVASKVVMAQNFINGGFTESWSESSKDLSVKIVTGLLVEKSGVLEKLKAQEAISDIEVYKILKDTLSRSDFVEQLLWEYTANGLVDELANSGSQLLLDSVLKETQNRLTIKIERLESK